MSKPTYESYLFAKSDILVKSHCCSHPSKNKNTDSGMAAANPEETKLKAMEPASFRAIMRHHKEDMDSFPPEEQNVKKMKKNKADWNKFFTDNPKHKKPKAKYRCKLKQVKEQKRQREFIDRINNLSRPLPNWVFKKIYNQENKPSTKQSTQLEN